MTFLNVNDFLNHLKTPELKPEEQAIVDFYAAAEDFSVAMANYRAKQNLNQKGLAEFLGTTQSNVSRFESGVYNFTLKKLFELAALMSINVKVCIENNENCETQPIVPNQQLLKDNHEICNETDKLATAA